MIKQQGDGCVCVTGDFNAVRGPNERAVRGESLDYKDIEAFDNFICQSQLIDLPISHRSYTWYQIDGSRKRKLDRALVNFA